MKYEFIKEQMVKFWEEKKDEFNSDIDIKDSLVESIDLSFEELDEEFQEEIKEYVTINHDIVVPTHTIGITDDTFISAVYMLCHDEDQPLDDLFIFIFNLDKMETRHIVEE